MIAPSDHIKAATERLLAENPSTGEDAAERVYRAMQIATAMYVDQMVWRDGVRRELHAYLDKFLDQEECAHGDPKRILTLVQDALAGCSIRASGSSERRRTMTSFGSCGNGGGIATTVHPDGEVTTASLAPNVNGGAGLVDRDFMAEYLSLLRELLEQRRVAGGKLPEGLESAHVARLDVLWGAMSEVERDDAERALRSEVSRGPDGRLAQSLEPRWDFDLAEFDVAIRTELFQSGLVHPDDFDGEGKHKAHNAVSAKDVERWCNAHGIRNVRVTIDRSGIVHFGPKHEPLDVTFRIAGDESE